MTAGRIRISGVHGYTDRDYFTKRVTIVYKVIVIIVCGASGTHLAQLAFLHIAAAIEKATSKSVESKRAFC